MEQQKVKFCKVCKDVGQPKEKYISHFVKDVPGGRIVCPYLLNIQCRRCNEKGHTESYCTTSIIKSENSTTMNINENIYRNIIWNWSELYDDESSDDESRPDSIS